MATCLPPPLLPGSQLGMRNIKAETNFKEPEDEASKIIKLV